MAKLTQKERIEQLTEQMNENVSKFKTDPKEQIELSKYLSRFYNYSTRNILLIRGQYEGAIGVASYKQHQKDGYQVQKGEKAIRILAPKMAKKFQDEQGKWKFMNQATKEEKQKISNGTIKTKQKLSGYISVPVFDITQTDCPEEDYPEMYPNKPENYDFQGTEKDFEDLNKAIKKYAKDRNIGVEIESTRNASKGFYSPAMNHIVIDNKLGETETTKVLLHELAHAEMHNKESIIEKTESGEDISAPIREYQAEMTSFIIADKFGIDSEEYTEKYIANWTEKEIENESFITSLEEVHSVSNYMIEEINQNYQQYQRQEQKLFTEDNLSVINELDNEKIYCSAIGMDKKKNYVMNTVRLKDSSGNNYKEHILTVKEPTKKELDQWKKGITGEEWLNTDLKNSIAKSQPENLKNMNIKEPEELYSINEAIENEISYEQSPSL